MTHRLSVREHDRSGRSAKRERGTGRSARRTKPEHTSEGPSPWRQQQRRMVQYPDVAGWLRWVSKALERRGPKPSQPVMREGTRQMGQKPQEGPGGSRGPHGRSSRSKASKGEPQTRDRDGTSPAGLGGSNASRGCETLRAQPSALTSVVGTKATRRGSRAVMALPQTGKTR